MMTIAQTPPRHWPDRRRGRLAINGSLVVAQTPTRLSLAGGGSDMHAFYVREPGAAVGMTIDKFIYTTVHPSFDRRLHVRSAGAESVDHATQLSHLLTREVLLQRGIESGLEITSTSDIPMGGSGLGSSSAFTVGLLNAVGELQGQPMSPERLAREACQVEIERCGKPIGKQDQYFAAYGGLRCFEFREDDTVSQEAVACTMRTRQQLEDHLLLLYTGVTRSADEILHKQRAALLADTTKRDYLRIMAQCARDLGKRLSLEQGNFDFVGETLHYTWTLKQQLAEGIANDAIRRWYAVARRAGAIGGKIAGAGGGGFLLLYAHPDVRGRIVAALPELRHVPFKITSRGSTIVYRHVGEDR